MKIIKKTATIAVISIATLGAGTGYATELRSQLVGTWFCANHKGYINKEVYYSDGTRDVYDTGYVPGVAGKRLSKKDKWGLQGNIFTADDMKRKVSISGDTLYFKFQSGHGYSCEREF